MSRTAPNPAHRPKKVVTVTPEQLIGAMAQVQCPKSEIASRLGIGIELFDKTASYQESFHSGRAYGKAKLRQQMVAVAMAGNPQMLIFLGKSILGMKETSALELSGPDGTAIQVDTNNARERLANLVARSADRDGPGPVPVVTH